MQAGNLDRQIVIQNYTTEDDGYGNEVPTWSVLATVWASVEQSDGREFFAQAAIQNDRRLVMRIRWRDDLRTDQRVIYQEIEHNIIEIREIGRNVGLELHLTSDG